MVYIMFTEWFVVVINVIVSYGDLTTQLEIRKNVEKS